MLWLDYYWHKVLKRPYTLSRRIDTGKGHPVVFLHGIASNGENWRQVADMLDKKQYRVIVFDLLGFGDSPRPDWLEYSVQDHADAVVASLRRMGIRRPITLVGHSMGSLVAARIARKYPDKISHLILYQMPMYARIPRLKTKDLKRQAYLSVFRYLAEHRKVTLWYARVLGKFASRVAGFVLDEKSWQPFELSLKNTIMQQHSYENLQKLTMPTDVIHGRFDVFVLRKNLQHILRPSHKFLRFYEIDEFHRISERSSVLLHELITKGPDDRSRVKLPHVRLLDMENSEKPKQKKDAPKTTRKRFLRIALYAFLGVVGSTIVALQGNLPAWELAMFTWINGWDAPVFMDVLATFASDIVWAVVFLVAFMLLIRKYFWTAYSIAVPATTTYATIFITEIIVGRPRPDVLLPDETIQRAVQDGMGFPSGHMATMTMIILVLWPRLSLSLRVAAVILLVLVGWSRVFLGVHFPLDIFGAVAYAVLVYSAFQLLPKSLRSKLKLR